MEQAAKHRIFQLLMISFALACSSPRIDMTNEETLKASSANVRASLPVDQQEEFDSSLRLALSYKTQRFIALSERASTFKDVSDVAKHSIEELESEKVVNESKIYGFLHGKSGAEVIDTGKAIEKEYDFREIASLARHQRRQAKDEPALNKVSLADVATSVKIIHTYKSAAIKGVVDNRTEAAIGFVGVEFELSNDNLTKTIRINLDEVSFPPGKSPFHFSLTDLLWPSALISEDLKVTHWRVMEFNNQALDMPTGSFEEFTETDARRLSELQEKYPDWQAALH